MNEMRKVEVLRAACCVAGIDGHTAEPERRILDKLAGEVGVGFASLTAMVERAQTDKNFYDEQFRVLKADPKDTMRLLFAIAVVDGKLSKSEAIVLKRLAHRLEVPDKTFDRWLVQAIEYVKSKKKSEDS